eukprot:4680159-Pleurochrysis_carterae.AAC.1
MPLLRAVALHSLRALSPPGTHRQLSLAPCAVPSHRAPCATRALRCPSPSKCLALSDYTPRLSPTLASPIRRTW